MCDFWLNLLLVIVPSIFRYASSSNVFLTVEGEVSLVGPHCPGTVRLFCEGVDLSTLEWEYNDLSIGIFYIPTDSVDTTPRPLANSALVSVQLTRVSEDAIKRVANFSSILTVDQSQLVQQNIMSISCGDAVIRKTVPMDVHLIQETAPADPQLISVNATSTFNDGPTSLVSIKWKPVCVISTIVTYINPYTCRLLSVLSTKREFTTK